MSCKFRERIGGKGCKYISSGYCTHDENQYYRCIDYITSGKFNLSHSQKQTWERCPYKWYLEYIKGIRVKKEHDSVAMRMGSELQRLVSGVGEPEFFGISEQYNKQLVNLMVKIIREYELLPDDAKWEVKCKRDNYRGVIDFTQDHKHRFGEIKFTTNPSRYLSKPSAALQLKSYFYLRPDLKDAFMLPVQVSKLKDKKDQERDLKIKRIEKDVRKRMKFYFPGYEPDREPPKWGQRFSAKEFDLEEFEHDLKWVREEIMRACETEWFTQRTANCDNPFKCDFLPVFLTGGVNWEIFERKTRSPDGKV